VLPLRNLDAGSLVCTTGHNSPAARPEFVDISLNATTNAAAETPEEVDEGDEE
jgi:hypothetical protein